MGSCPARAATDPPSEATIGGAFLVGISTACDWSVSVGGRLSWVASMDGGDGLSRSVWGKCGAHLIISRSSATVRALKFALGTVAGRFTIGCMTLP
jgi:hypothetical protein